MKKPLLSLLFLGICSTFVLSPSYANTYSSYVGSYAHNRDKSQPAIQRIITHSMRNLPANILNYYGASESRRRLVQNFCISLSQTPEWMHSMVNTLYTELQFEEKITPQTVNSRFLQHLYVQLYEKHSSGLKKLTVDDVHFIFQNELDLMTYLKNHDCDICTLENAGFASYAKSTDFYAEKDNDYIYQLLAVQRRRILAPLLRQKNVTKLTLREYERFDENMRFDFEKVMTPRQKKALLKDDNIIGSKNSYRAYCEKRWTALKLTLAQPVQDPKLYVYMCDTYFK